MVPALFTSTATINRWRKRYQNGGINAVLTRPRKPSAAWWVCVIIVWVTTHTPIDFGFVHSRWSDETVAIVLRVDYKVRVGPGRPSGGGCAGGRAGVAAAAAGPGAEGPGPRVQAREDLECCGSCWPTRLG